MPLTLRSTPRISAAQFARVLERYKSPCTPIARECYDIIAGAGLDPAVALAFFGRESVFGTRGIANELKNWGNVRAPHRAERATGKHPRNYAIYPTWQEGLRDWCDRINERYINERGLDTVEKAVPVYAPSFDGNVPQAYIEHVARLVNQWVEEEKGGAAPVAAQAPPDGDATLRDELLKLTFMQAGSAFSPDSPLHQYVVSEMRAGRPLGNPLGDVKQVTVNGQAYLVQVFALDTLFSPLANRSAVYRLSDLLQRNPSA